VNKATKIMEKIVRDALQRESEDVEKALHKALKPGTEWDDDDPIYVAVGRMIGGYSVRGPFHTIAQAKGSIKDFPSGTIHGPVSRRAAFSLLEDMEEGAVYPEGSVCFDLERAQDARDAAWSEAWEAWAKDAFYHCDVPMDPQGLAECLDQVVAAARLFKGE